MAKHPFLSDEWFSEVRAIQDRMSGGPSHGDMHMNLVVTDTPFSADKHMHMATVAGKADWGDGHLEGADLTLTLDYATAKDLFVGGNPQAGMQAFMSGKIKADGDVSKLMAMQQGGGGGGGAGELTKAIQEVTE